MLGATSVRRSDIIARVSEKEIFEHYLNHTVEFNKLYKNPLRVDNNEGCSYFESNQTERLIFHDIAWKKKFDCFDVVMYIYKVSFPKAIEIVWHDLIEKRGENHSVDAKLIELRNKKIKRKVRVKRRNFKKDELAFWTRNGKFPDINQEVLTESKIFTPECYWIDDAPTCNCKMIFGYHFADYDYQLYFPLRKKGEMRFDNPSGIKYGGTERVNYVLDYVVITKSNKDSFYLKYFGVNNFFIINEAIVLNKEFMDSIAHFKYIFTLFDNDKTGRHLSWLYRKEYNTIPLFVPEGNDFTEFIDIVEPQDITDYIGFLKNEYSIS